MPKLKTHSGAKKRLKRTGTGKIVRKPSGKRHLNTGKGASRLRRLSVEQTITPGHMVRLNRVIPA